MLNLVKALRVLTVILISSCLLSSTLYGIGDKWEGMYSGTGTYIKNNKTYRVPVELIIKYSNGNYVITIENPDYEGELFGTQMVGEDNFAFVMICNFNSMTTFKDESGSAKINLSRNGITIQGTAEQKDFKGKVFGELNLRVTKFD